MTPGFAACFSCFVCLIVCGIGIYYIFEGQKNIDTGRQYGTFGTKERCEITGEDNAWCSCGKGCTGDKYLYYAIAETKCGRNITLKANDYDPSGCSENNYKHKRDNGNVYDCYVLSCDNKSFSWGNGADLVTKGKGQI
eukprot:131919_1